MLIFRHEGSHTGNPKTPAQTNKNTTEDGCEKRKWKKVEFEQLGRFYENRVSY